MHKLVIEHLEDSTKALLHFINSYDTLEEQVTAWLKDDSEEQLEINAAYTHSQRFEQEFHKKTSKKSIKELVPKEFHEFLLVFDEKAASRLPESKRWDHKIDLKEGFTPKLSKIYPLTMAEET